MVLFLGGAAVVVSLLPEREAPAPHVVLVVLDTVRRDRTSLAGAPVSATAKDLTGSGSRETTPFLAELARGGVDFSHARAPAEWTLPSHASLFTGMLPSEHGCHFEHRYLPDEALTLAEELGRHGYRTAAFSSNPNVSRAFNLDQGFDAFVEVFADPDARRGQPKSRILLRELERWLEANRSRPLFLFVNLMDAHLPYEADPAELERRLGRPPRLDPAELAAPELLDRVLAGERPLDEAFREELAARYDAALRTVDDRLRELVALLERTRILDDAVLVVTSDHGEHLGEGGLVDHHGALSEALLRVPLVMSGSALPSGLVIDEPVGIERVMGWLLGARIGGFKPERLAPPPLPVAERFAAIEVAGRLERLRPQVDRAFLERRERAVVSSDGRFKRVEREDGSARLFAISLLAAEREVDAAQHADVDSELREALAASSRGRQAVVERFAPERETPPDSVDLAREGLAQSGYLGGAASEGGSVHAQVHLERGNRAFARGDVAAAREEFLAASGIDSRFAPAYFNLAAAIEKAGAPRAEQKAAWERYLEVALRATPDDAASIQAAYGRLAALEDG